MKVSLVYLRILKKFDPNFPEHRSYEQSAKRFLETYLKFKPEVPHDLVVVDCGTGHTDTLFDGVASRYYFYAGGGYDCGTFQAIVPYIKCDLAICLNTHTHFWRHSWLEPFMIAFACFGDGMFGATASFEQHPHLRTPAFAITPKVMGQYPVVVDSREKAALFEAGPDNLSQWVMRRNLPAVMVTPKGFFLQNHWRTPPDIFRRGDQSNCLVWDRHTQLYAEASESDKLLLARSADGL